MVHQSSTTITLTNGTSTPNGIIKSSADSPATSASTSVAPPKPEKAAKPAPRLSIETVVEQLSAALGHKWDDYGRELNLFIIGKRTRMELQDMLDQVLVEPTLKKLHNNLLMTILANASRDPPGGSSSFLGWNRNKKRKEPMTTRARSSGKQKKLRTDIMGLGPQERNRIKSFKSVMELDPVNTLGLGAYVQNERKLYQSIPGAILESRKAKLPPRLPKEKNFQPTHAVQMEIIKGLNVPMASETLELPSIEDISDRAKGIAYDHQLSHGIGPNVPELVLAGLDVQISSCVTNKSTT
jgi:transcriptional coactivator HFI1/ADA1